MIPVVSVVIPCFNAARWLEAALHSVLTEFKPKIEVIVVDDGSTDQTRAIIKNAAQRDQRVRSVLLSDNRGIVYALNTALDVAEGKFIARMDADDIAMPTRFSRQVDFIHRTGCDLCGSWFMEFGQGMPRKVRWPYSEAALSAAMLFQNTICHPTVMARRKVFDKYRYRENYQLAEDYDLFIRASTEFRLANLPEVLLRYRRHPSQATISKRGVMEAVTRRIRYEALLSKGIEPTPKELMSHNLIRAPYSITEIAHLIDIENWLLKLLSHFSNIEARQVIASQWIRACVRAAPLGQEMWRLFLGSKLCQEANVNWGTRLDLRALSILKLDYQSIPFETLRRFGLSA